MKSHKSSQAQNEIEDRIAALSSAVNDAVATVQTGDAKDAAVAAAIAKAQELIARAEAAIAAAVAPPPPPPPLFTVVAVDLDTDTGPARQWLDHDYYAQYMERAEAEGFKATVVGMAYSDRKGNYYADRDGRHIFAG
jgi:hypothetical protein